MANRSRGFNSASTIKGKGPDVDRLVKDAQSIRSNVSTFCARLLSEAAGLDRADIVNESRISEVDIKKRHSIHRKVGSQYDHDRRQVDDVCRVQIYTRSPSEMQSIMNALEDYYGKAKRNHFNGKGQMVRNPHHFQDTTWQGIRIRELDNDCTGETTLKDYKDHVHEPKRWGWQGLTLKLEAQTAKGRWVPFEVQIFPENMKKSYEFSHKSYEKIRNEIEEWEAYCDEHKNKNRYAPPPSVAEYFSHIRYDNLATQLQSQFDERKKQLLSHMSGHIESYQSASEGEDITKSDITEFGLHAKAEAAQELDALNAHYQEVLNGMQRRNAEILFELDRMVEAHKQAGLASGMSQFWKREFPSIDVALSRPQDEEEIYDLVDHDDEPDVRLG